MDLKGSMELAGRNLLANLCPTRHYLPYSAIEIDAGYGAWARFSSYSSIRTILERRKDHEWIRGALKIEY